MEIIHGKQVKSNEIKDKNFDLFICTENHEKRSYTLYDNLKDSNIFKKRFAFCYKESICNIKTDDFNKVKINNHLDIYNLLDIELANINDDHIYILIDYSCMTKSWYYSIILYFKNKKFNDRLISIFFCYTPAKFNEPKEPKPNREIGPLPGKYIVPTDKPKALIVCLGYEQNKAEGIIEHLDPKISYLFYTDPASDNKFLNKLKINNEQIIHERKGCVITYPFNDLIYLEHQITSLYFQLKDEYSIIIAPLGPKPFTFISMLMSAKYIDIDIWRVGSGNDINEYENQPIDNKSFIICEILFGNTNLYYN